MEILLKNRFATGIIATKAIHRHFQQDNDRHPSACCRRLASRVAKQGTVGDHKKIPPAIIIRVFHLRYRPHHRLPQVASAFGNCAVACLFVHIERSFFAAIPKTPRTAKFRPSRVSEQFPSAVIRQ
ncbi:hypothetical protein EFQ99_03340 [Rhizobium vallis]|uniref:Uncharacterized protein n=1 Tax=Rhizobium vallis TaxID=634290 RepID=A0A3S0QYH4_9HYPH|nr:hypothetical protein EFQ99_03340 [Rhizobium vallis]